MRRLFVLAVFSLVVALCTGAPAATGASDTPCTGTIGAVTVENVVVPPNATCRLIGTQVLGNVRVLTNARFGTQNANIHGNVWSEASFFTDLYNGTTVGGDVQIRNSAADTDICGAEIGGDLQFEGLGGTLDAARIGETAVHFPIIVGVCVAGTNRVIVHGNFQAWDNQRPVDLYGNRIDGDVQYFDNTTGGEVFNNQIGGGLQCRGNGTMLGGGNTAAYKEGQCATF
jgi:hypothetical protein